MSSSLQPSGEFKFTSEEGRTLVRNILSTHFTYAPHDYQIDGVCKALDGVHVLAIIPTGGGKTGFFLMYILVLQALAAEPELRPRSLKRPIIQDPAIIIVFPTVSLEEEMDHVFKAKGLKTLVINHNTKTEAFARHGEDLWLTARKDVSVILLAPEQLVVDGFGDLIKSKEFAARICMLGVDEVHLCNSWGAGFRPLFTQIGFAAKRLHERTVLMLTTATLAVGKATDNVLNFFGLRAGGYYLIRRSNIRYDIQVLVRVLTKGLQGLVFPDLDEIATSNRKTVLFCATIRLGDYIAEYLRQLLPPNPTADLHVRSYNSLNYGVYNTKTLEMFRNNPETKIIVATDTLMVGVDLPNVQDVVIVGTPETVDEMVQKFGRAGRDRNIVSDARGIVYITKTSLEKAEELAENDFQKKTENSRAGYGKSETKQMDPDIARMIVAKCKIQAQNEIYGNPAFDACPCTCPSCSSLPPPRPHCNCSGCMPEASTSPSDELQIVVEDMEPHSDEEINLPRLTGKLRDHVDVELRKLRWQLYLAAGEGGEHHSPYVYLPDPIIKNLLTHFYEIRAVGDLGTYLRGETFVLPNQHWIWSRLQVLCGTVDRMHEAARVERREKDRERRRAKAAEREIEEREKVADETSDEEQCKLQYSAPDKKQKELPQASSSRRREKQPMPAVAAPCAQDQQSFTYEWQASIAPGALLPPETQSMVSSGSQPLGSVSPRRTRASRKRDRTDTITQSTMGKENSLVSKRKRVH